MAGTIKDKLDYLQGTKTAIKEAIEAKGVTVAPEETFRGYAAKIGEIQAGGGGGGISQQEIVNALSEFGYWQDYVYYGDVVMSTVTSIFGEDSIIDLLPFTVNCQRMYNTSDAKYRPFFSNDMVSKAGVPRVKKFRLNVINYNAQYSSCKENAFDYKCSLFGTNKAMPVYDLDRKLLEINVTPQPGRDKMLDKICMAGTFYNTRYAERISEDLIPSDCYKRIKISDETFMECYCLLEIPKFYIDNAFFAPDKTVENTFTGCSALREIVDLNFYLEGFEDGVSDFGYANITSGFNNSYNVFSHLNSLKRLRFRKKGDNTPFKIKYTESIDLSYVVGHFRDYDLSYHKIHPNFTDEKEIKDDESYNRLKNDPWAWTQMAEYSFYNKASAIETIDSLPILVDCTATIIFEGIAGSKTDGGAINTMTPEEIKVATDKGWTVKFI